MDRDVGVGDGRLFQILIHAAASANELALQFDGDARAVIDLDPLDAMFLDVLRARFSRGNVLPVTAAVQDLGQVAFRIDLDLVVVCRFAGRNLGDDLHWLAGRQHAVHAGGADADALLAAAHSQAVKLRAVEQLAEDQRDLLLEDARAVVLDADLEAVDAGRLDVNPDLRQDAGFLTGIQRIVNRFLDRGKQGLAGVVEAEQVAVLGKELTDRDIPLAGGHRLGRRAATWPTGVAVCARTVRVGIAGAGIAVAITSDGSLHRRAFLAAFGGHQSLSNGETWLSLPTSLTLGGRLDVATTSCFRAGAPPEDSDRSEYNDFRPLGQPRNARMGGKTGPIATFVLQRFTPTAPTVRDCWWGRRTDEDDAPAVTDPITSRPRARAATTHPAAAEQGRRLPHPCYRYGGTLACSTRCA